MIGVILVGGVDNSLERELINDVKLRGVPRALLPVGGKPMLNIWWSSILETREVTNVYLVCNALNYKHFERWGSANGVPAVNIVNNGATSKMNQMGAARDLQLALRRARADGLQTKEVIVFAGDSLFYKEFDLQQVIDCYRHVQREQVSLDVSLVLYYQLGVNEDPTKRGIVQVDASTNKLTSFEEKPLRPKSRLACPLFYILGATALGLLDEFVGTSITNRGCGQFLESAVDKTSFFGLRLPSGFNLVGVSAGLQEYRALNRSFMDDLEKDDEQVFKPQEIVPKENIGNSQKRVHTTCYARVGLLGNPSDGFNGKTIALTISNFYAEVWLEASDKIRLIPHPLFDPNEFGTLNDLHSIAVREGYHGGMRLLMGTLKRFYQLCLERSIALPRKNFTVRYDTNIPRQVGLSGSSAIVTATFRALMEWYGLTEDDIPKPLQPNFVLSVETEEMGITAGLQDRVVQCYEGLVYMDFAKELLDRDKHGLYNVHSSSLLPSGLLFLAYQALPSDSGRAHSNVKERWLQKDPEVIEAMKAFGGFAEEGMNALLDGNHERFGELMNMNFDLRRKVYGDPCIGKVNLELIEIARENGAFGKFPGSGGAIVGMARSIEEIPKLQKAYEDRGYVFSILEPSH